MYIQYNKIFSSGNCKQMFVIISSYCQNLDYVTAFGTK